MCSHDTDHPAGLCYAQLNHPRSSAFTLIELLATIATLSLLGMIIFAVSSSGIRKARRSAAISNLRQIGVAAHTYSNEHSRRVIPYRSTEFDGSTTYFFQYLSAYYMDGSSDPFIAPGDDLKLYTVPTRLRGPYKNLATEAVDVYYSFARNMELPKPSNQTFVDSGTAINFSMPSPSNTALLFLTRQNAAMYRSYPAEYHGLSDGDEPTETLVSFLDGSVRTFTIVELSEDTPEMRELWYGFPDATGRQDY